MEEKTKDTFRVKDLKEVLNKVDEMTPLVFGVNDSEGKLDYGLFIASLQTGTMGDELTAIIRFTSLQHITADGKE